MFINKAEAFLQRIPLKKEIKPVSTTGATGVTTSWMALVRGEFKQG